MQGITRILFLLAARRRATFGRCPDRDGHDYRSHQGSERRRATGCHGHDDPDRNRPQGKRRHRLGGPFRVGPVAARHLSDRCRVERLQVVGAVGNRVDDQRDRARRFHAGGWNAAGSRGSRGGGVARRCEFIIDRQVGRQPSHCGAAAEHAQRLLPDLPDARRRGNHRQRLRGHALHDQRRAAAEQRHARRRRHRDISDRDGRSGYFGLPFR